MNGKHLRRFHTLLANFAYSRCSKNDNTGFLINVSRTKKQISKPIFSFANSVPSMNFEYRTNSLSFLGAKSFKHEIVLVILIYGGLECKFIGTNRDDQITVLSKRTQTSSLRWWPSIGVVTFLACRPKGSIGDNGRVSQKAK